MVLSQVIFVDMIVMMCEVKVKHVTFYYFNLFLMKHC